MSKNIVKQDEKHTTMQIVIQKQYSYGQSFKKVKKVGNSWERIFISPIYFFIKYV